jgi:hypothetical protein
LKIWLRMIRAENQVSALGEDLQRLFITNGDAAPINRNQPILLQSRQRPRDDLAHRADAGGYLLIRERKRDFAQEEQIVLPLLAKHTVADGAEIGETLEQHAAIVRLIEELIEKLARRETIEASLLINLAESLRRHIRYEESELFPAVEASVPEEELRLMNGRLLDRRFQGGDNG